MCSAGTACSSAAELFGAAPPDVATVTRHKNAVPDLYSAGVLSIRKSVLSSKETLCEKIKLLESQYITCDVLAMVNKNPPTYLTDSRRQADGILKIGIKKQNS